MHQDCKNFAMKKPHKKEVFAFVSALVRDHEQKAMQDAFTESLVTSVVYI